MNESINVFKKTWSLRKITCIFCGGENPDLYYRACAMYYDEKIPYHKSCYKDIMENPEEYSNKQVDSAIKITDFLKEKEKKRFNLLQTLVKSKKDHQAFLEITEKLEAYLSDKDAVKQAEENLSKDIAKIIPKEFTIR